MKCDTLLATVLHHNEMWNQQRALSDDMKKEILSLTERLKKKTYKVNCFVDLMSQYSCIMNPHLGTEDVLYSILLMFQFKWFLMALVFE